MNLEALVTHLRRTSGITHKQDIQGIASQLETYNKNKDKDNKSILLGDDCAAIPDGDSYLLLATEGILPAFVASDPWFAGWCSVMVNVSDIYAMGGRTIAVVDTLWSQSVRESIALWEGIQAAAKAYDVPIVGGHTNCQSPYNALAVSILGRATHLLTSFDSQPGDRLLLAIDFAGQPYPNYTFWNAATEADPIILRRNLNILPQLAECGLCTAGKDISMGGIVGTVLMMMETSGCGAILNVDSIPRPETVTLDWWLRCFPSFGFVLSVQPENILSVQTYFNSQNIVCESIGTVNNSKQIHLQDDRGNIALFWDLNQENFMGFTERIGNRE